MGSLAFAPRPARRSELGPNADAATRTSDREPPRRREDVASPDYDPWTELAEILHDMLAAASASGPSVALPTPHANLAPISPQREEAPAQQGHLPAPTITPTEAEPRPPPAPTGRAMDMLRGGVETAEPEAVELPQFPQGGTAIPEAAPLSAAPAEAPQRRAAPAPRAGAEAPEGRSPGAIVRNWQAQVSAGAAAIPVPQVRVPEAGRARLSRAYGAARARNEKAREGLTQDAIDTVPKPPELDTTPPAPPPPNPVPEHTRAVLAASGKHLPNQTAPALERSEVRDVEGQSIGGSLPPLGVQPVADDLFQVLITPGARDLAQIPGASATSEIAKRERERVERALETLTKTDEVSDRQGRGPQVISPDLGPTKPAPISQSNKAHVGALVARLLADTHQTATGVLADLRKGAYGDEVLTRTFPDVGADMLPGLEEALSGELHDIADAAGISGDELARTVAERREELERSEREAAETVRAEGETATETATEEGQKTSDAIAGAAEAAEEETLNRQAAVSGEADPAVVNARRDRIVAWFREQVTTQITNYQRAGDKREKELTEARDDQLSGYRTLTQREVYQVMTPTAPRAERDTADTARERRLTDIVALMRAWRDKRIAGVGEHFRLALSTAATTTRTHRKTIEDAGSTGIEAARRWAEDKILENESWWDRFIARIRRWLSEAKDVNEQWRVRRGVENRDAIANDLDSIQLAFSMVREGTDLNAALQSDQLTDEQKEAIVAFFRQPKGTHPLDFAEMRLRQNLTRDHQPGANEIFERELIATPVGPGDHATANKLNAVARQQSGGFDSAAIAQSVHAAMDQWGTNEQQIYDSLNGLTVLQGAVVRKMYMAIFGSNLDSDLEDELSGEELDQAKAQIEGKQSQADAIALHDAMSGLGTDEAAIMKALRNKTPAEREAIRAEYLRLYGRSLDTDLEDDLSEGNEIDQANALLAGDNALADAIAMDEAMRGGFLPGTSEGEIEEVQARVRREVLAKARAENWTSDQMEAEVRRRLGEIEGKFSDRYKNVEQYNAPGLEGETVLRRALGSELSGSELDLANALQDNDLIRADAARIEIERTSFYASDDKINGVLRSQYERALEARRLDEGPARNMRVSRLVATLREQGKSEEEISAERMKLEREMEKELEAGAQRDSRMSMQSLKNVYQDKYFWPLDFVIEVNTSGYERNMARDLLAQGGKLEPIQEVEYAVRGVGTNEEKLREVFGRLTDDEIEELAGQWKTRNHSEDLRDVLKGELSGRDESDVLDMYDYGVPKSALEQIAQEERRVRREMTELTGPLGGAAAGREADWMNSELSRLQELKSELTRTDWPDTEEGRRARARLSEDVDFRVGRVQAAVADHRRRIDSVTDTVTQVVGIVVAVVVGAIVTVATAGTAAPAVIAAWAALAGSLAATAATMATKALIKGGSYGIEDVGVDAAVGVVDAVTAFVTAGMGSRLIRPLTTLARGSGLPALAGRLARTGMARRLAQAEGGAVLARIGRSIVPTREGVERAMAGFVAEGIEDAASALPSAILQTGLNDQTWQGDPLANFLEGGGMAIMQSVIVGRTLGAGMSLGGSLAHAGRGMWRERSGFGQLLELNRLVSESYGSYRHENPNASIGDFMASPQGRKLQFEIDQRGLMTAIRAASEAADINAPPPSAHARADANAVAARNGAAPEGAAPPRVAEAEARAESLHQMLPANLREGSFVTPAPELSGRTVRVEPLRIGKEIVGVDIRVGPDATALDIALHAATVDAMLKYRGLLGSIRRAWHDMLARASGSGWVVGSRGWEAQFELAKLPAIIYERMDALSGSMLGPQAHARIQADLDALTAQYHAHEAILNDPVAGAAPGRGFVAAEAADTRTPLTPDEVVARLSENDLDGLRKLAKLVFDRKVPPEPLWQRVSALAKKYKLSQADIEGALSFDVTPEQHAELLMRKIAETENRAKTFAAEAENVDVEGTTLQERLPDLMIDWMRQAPVEPGKPRAESPDEWARFDRQKQEYDLMRQKNEALDELIALSQESAGPLLDTELYQAAVARFLEADAALARMREEGSLVSPQEAGALSGRRPEARREARILRGMIKTDEGFRLEGMAELSMLRQNIGAVARIREILKRFNPGLILGVQRGGAFMVEVVGDGFVVQTVGKAKGNKRAPNLVKAITAAIEGGQRRFVLVDVYMGGGAINDFRHKVLDVVLENHPHLREELVFQTVWLREQHGFERTDLDPALEKVMALMPYKTEVESVARLREAARLGEEQLRAVVEDLMQAQGLRYTDPELAGKPLSKDYLSPDEVRKLQQILLADPSEGLHLADGGLEAVSRFGATYLKLGENYFEEFVPVRLAVGDDMSMVLEPGTSPDPVVVVDARTGRYQVFPLGIRDPVTDEILDTQRKIVASILKGHFNGLWE